MADFSPQPAPPPEPAADPAAGRRPRGNDSASNSSPVLIGAAASVAALAAVGTIGAATGALPVPTRVRRLFQDTGTNGEIPDAPVGVTTFELRVSQARGREVGFYTAVPEGHGDGAGLPVCLVLHGASATTADYASFGFAQFLTAARRARGATVRARRCRRRTLAMGGDGAGDDPQRMLFDEIPAWCADRGYDGSRLAVYGWSMGGYGALLAAIRNPGGLSAVAALSPAVGADDEVATRADELDPARTAVWCGTADSLHDAVEAMAARIPGGPAIEAYAPGAHTRGYWNRITPEAFAFVGNSFTIASSATLAVRGD